MNKLIFLLTGSFIALLLATSCNDKRAVDVGVRTKMDSISYCIGIVYGQNLHGDGFDTINPWVIARAFDDLFDEKDLAPYLAKTIAKGGGNCSLVFAGERFEQHDEREFTIDPFQLEVTR